MKIKSFVILTILLFTSFLTRADDIDSLLKKYIDDFKITPINESISKTPLEKFKLGEALFNSKLLSGNQTISCKTCHDVKLGTSDGLALSQTYNGKGVLKRNSLSLFNTGLERFNHMFWDGRVHFDRSRKIFITPEARFNGLDPYAKEITSIMTSALSMQTIFPILSREEMRGMVGENEAANESDNLKAWEIVVKSILKDPLLFELLKKTYPNVEDDNYSIGHIGEALAHYIRNEFYSDGSPFNQYLKGNNTALTRNQKEGFRVFIERGKCIACHSGGLLGNNDFFTSVGAPQFGARPASLDFGREEVNRSANNRFFFRVPSLLNLKVTGPYMHNGAYETIREVINHYSNPKIFLESFDINLSRSLKFPVEIEVLSSPKNINDIFESIQMPILKRGFHFTEIEKGQLEDFLENGLMDPKFNL